MSLQRQSRRRDHQQPLCESACSSRWRKRLRGAFCTGTNFNSFKWLPYSTCTAQQTKYTGLMLHQCWFSVGDAGPALVQHSVDFSLFFLKQSTHRDERRGNPPPHRPPCLPDPAQASRFSRQACGTAEKSGLEKRHPRHLSCGEPRKWRKV